MAPLILVLALSTQVAAWDTVEPAGDLSKRSGWKALEGGASPQGDLVVTNGKIMGVARKQASGLELYSLRTGSPIYRSRLAPAGAGPMEKAVLAEVGRGGAAMEISWKGSTIRFRIPKGELFVESQALAGDAPLR